jgi:hypothetical protein
LAGVEKLIYQMPLLVIIDPDNPDLEEISATIKSIKQAMPSIQELYLRGLIHFSKSSSGNQTEALSQAFVDAATGVVGFRLDLKRPPPGFMDQLKWSLQRKGIKWILE